ncbi:alpha/beta hydrolase fold protein [Cellulophaga algicola DSM 14237]|uniref:Alpha/beta hydrolase fold protein n=1 Tax=Cellulophaga algicola (strain DSM 14237 / IC166 / ACAM 630) TaxID=688270 RepID=E6XCW3_CELAD|nr:alpha/beta hydrolase [Cellulophaga algicola]ADV50104.1 alpha/beta hydrolase fold protein [Cellulophaga algicola DSM 14237]
MEKDKAVKNSKKAIVFLHYFGGDAGSWQWVSKHLKSDYTCLPLTLPGFGGTSVSETPSISSFSKFINDEIATLELKDYILVGHSMGGKLALHAALQNVDNPPSKIILVAPSPPTTEDMSAQEKKRMLKHTDRAEAIQTVKNGIVKSLKKERFDYAVNSQLKIAEVSWQWWLNTGMNNSIATQVINLETPVSVIFSMDDSVIKDVAIQKEVLPYLKKATPIPLNGIGHLIPLEAPKKLALLLKQIIA